MKALRLSLLLALSLSPSACLDTDYLLFLPIRLDEYELPDNHIPAEALEELSLTTADGVQIAAFFARQDEPTAAPTVLFLHGQGGNLDWVWKWPMLFWDKGYNVLAIDYRGFGKSQGEPTEEGLYEDAGTGLAYLLEADVDRSRILIWGYSLGTGVASKLALERPMRGLALEAPFTSMSAMVEGSSPYVMPAEWMTEIELDTLSRIGQIATPLLVAHGTKDRRVPYWMGEEVFDRAPQPKRFVRVEGAGHMRVLTLGQEQIWAALRELDPALVP